jgi:hypothetical protein
VLTPAGENRWTAERHDEETSETAGTLHYNFTWLHQYFELHLLTCLPKKIQAHPQLRAVTKKQVTLLVRLLLMVVQRRVVALTMGDLDERFDVRSDTQKHTQG